MSKIIEGPNGPQVFERLSHLGDDTRRGIRQAFFKLGKDLKAEADRQVLQEPKTGRVYIRRTPGGRRRRHQASAPGESAANFRGTLRKSISWQVNGTSELDFGYGVSSNQGGQQAPEYAGAIEEGRRDGSIQARPTIANTVNRIDREANEHFRREILKEVGG